MQCILYKIYFWNVFHMYCKLICILYALLCGQNFILVKMWVLHDSWRDSFTMWLYLTAKPSHVGVDVDGLAYTLHHPMVCCCQTWGQDLLPGIVLSSHCGGRWHLSGDVKPPRAW
jgi:hypothetical protein